IATLTPRWTRANMFVARASGELGVLLVQSEPTRARALLEEAVGNAAAQATFGAELAHHTTALAGLLYATVATRPRARDLVATARTACVAAGAACADTLARWLATHP
ncbi:MAG TPA: hypothetical protein VK427_21555, partial [Kofleriaceae bacterium]|nr:hypothetical protein [Kofleriaceae bacterium]